MTLGIYFQVGTVVCRVKANDHDGDEVDFSIGPSPSVQVRASISYPVFIKLCYQISYPVLYQIAGGIQ